MIIGPERNQSFRRMGAGTKLAGSQILSSPGESCSKAILLRKDQSAGPCSLAPELFMVCDGPYFVSSLENRALYSISGVPYPFLHLCFADLWDSAQPFPAFFVNGISLFLVPTGIAKLPRASSWSPLFSQASLS